MSTKAQFTIVEKGKDVDIQIVGVIDEDVDFSAISLTNKENIIFDFEKCSLINSCGIREWIQFIGKISKDSKIFYVNCPQLIIEQVNMVKGFISDNAKVKSFQAPYFCETCDTERLVLLQADTVKNQKPPEIKCAECQYVMDFDALPAQYFHFLN